MNTWIEQNAVKAVIPNKGGLQKMIPVDKLTELFSKEGEELARAYAPDDDTESQLERLAYLEAYNLQQVKIEALRAEYAELKADRDDAAKALYDTIGQRNELQDKVDELNDENAALRAEVERLRNRLRQLQDDYDDLDLMNTIIK
jgi:peptidoglycan hydrolase CwlO-like protein